MKKSKLLAWLVCVWALNTYAQQWKPHFYPSTGMKILYDANSVGLSGYDTLRNPYTGGINNPMFSNIDLNHDGLQDLFVFDREDNKILPFLAHVKGSTSYIYAPQYEGCFPAGYDYATLVDYNHDGKPDMFTKHYPDGGFYSNALSLYKNVTQADKNPSFNIVYEGIVAKDYTDSESLISVYPNSNAVFADVNHDGKVDLLTIPDFQTQVRYFKNVSKDPEKLDLYYWDECWMKFQETLPRTYVPYNCNEGETNRSGKRASAHASVDINIYDVDGDGDMDLLRGDGNDNQLSIFTNGSTDAGHHYTDTDTMIDVRRGYPNNKPIAIYEMPYPSFVDVDNDHRTDIVVGPGKKTYPTSYLNNDFDRSNTIWYYHNDMDTTKGKKIPLFLYQQNNFLQNTTFDMGLASVPCLTDVNGDGYPDLIVASWGGSDYNKSYDHANLYLGDKKQHTFTPANYDFLSFSADSIHRKSPSAGDLDGDGITDIVVGNELGTVAFYKGTGSGTAKVAYNDAFQLKAQNLQYMDTVSGQTKTLRISTNSKPAIVDLNGDGKGDILLGNYGNGLDAHLAYFQNTGNDGNGIPQFKLITTNYKKIDFVSYTAPCVADFDNDGKPDLIVGSFQTGMRFYHDITDNVDSLIPRDSLFKNLTTGKFDGQTNLGDYLTAAAAKLDGDNLPDLMIGTARGGLYYMATQDSSYRWLGSRVGLAETVQPELMKGTVFPNPASQSLTFKYQDAPDGQKANIVITDILGRQIIERSITLQSGGQEYFDLQNISNGLYIFNVTAGNGQNLLNEKVIIQK
jgi:hypothetical protein